MLQRMVYRMIGSWQSVSGVKFVFREDGSCQIDGREYYYTATNYAFYIGSQPDELNQKWTIYSCENNRMSIQNDKTKSQYKLTKE